MMKTVAMIELVEKDSKDLKKESMEPTEMVCIAEELKCNENQKKSKISNPRDNVELPFIELNSEDWPELFGDENNAENKENETPTTIANSAESADKYVSNNLTKNNTEDMCLEEITVPKE